MSRFGRNYIMVGQYVDYIFAMYNIRFIALTDNIDTLNSDSASMDMLPIMNVFNEWHAANTSKKLRTVFQSNARAGKYMTTASSYGYVKGDDENYTPQIDPEAAAVVRRIFEMRASGMGHKSIADALNQEHITPPLDYKYDKLGRTYPLYSHHLWNAQTIRRILDNQMYLGKLVQMKETTVSYKNHKVIRKGKEDAIKHLVEIPMDENGSVPHDFIGKFGGGTVLLKRAPEGTGVIAGGPARNVLELAGVKNIRTKSLGSSNKQNVVLATIEGLKLLKSPEEVAKARGKKVEDILG